MSPTRGEADGDQRDASVSRIYQRTAARTAPQALDRRVLAAARKAHSGSPYLAPLALAASVLLSVAVVLAIAFGPHAARHSDEPVRVLRAAVRAGSPPSAGAPRAALKADRGPAHVPGTDLAPPLLGKRQLYTSDPPARDPQRWLAAIAALRKAGREPEAEAEYRRFRTAYPGFVTASGAPTGP